MVKPTLFSEDMIIYLREPTENLLLIIRECGKLQVIKLIYSNE